MTKSFAVLAFLAVLPLAICQEEFRDAAMVRNKILKIEISPDFKVFPKIEHLVFDQQHPRGNTVTNNYVIDLQKGVMSQGKTSIRFDLYEAQLISRDISMLINYIKTRDVEAEKQTLSLIALEPDPLTLSWKISKTDNSFVQNSINFREEKFTATEGVLLKYNLVIIFNYVSDSIQWWILNCLKNPLLEKPPADKLKPAKIAARNQNCGLFLN